MAEARDIGGISVPFAAGVAAGLLIFPSFGTASPLIPSLLAILTPSLALAAFLLFDNDSSQRIIRLSFAGIFLLAGFFCACNSCLTEGIPAGGSWLPMKAQGCADALRIRIDSLPYPHEGTGALVKALLTGDRNGLDPQVLNIFRASGAAHILALSGLHLGIIYLILLRLTAPLGNSPRARKARSFLIVFLSGFYCLMTGASPSIVRAFLFITINETAKLTGREKDPARVLLASLTIQLAIKPQVMSSLGFQLSYLAMCGIAFTYPWLARLYPQSGNRKWDGIDPVRKIWDMAVMSVSCQIFTAPLVWLRFHTFPKYFLLTNLLALPLTSATVVLSVATVALSSFGICPESLVILNDQTVRLLVSCLEIISSM